VATLSARFHRARRYFDLVDRWIVISEFTRELMVQSGWPERKLELIHLFAGPEFFAASPAKAAPGYVLYCGNFEPHKGADVLIRAYAQAVREGGAPAPRLKMAGGLDSPSAARCRELARELGVADRVEFPGFADAGGLAGLYAGALFTVIPSRWYENVPNVLIESYACGTAVLGTGHGSLAPLVEEGQTGRLFPPGDPAALAEAMRRSWSDPEWCRRAGLKAREKARALFSAQRHIESLLALFREVTGKN
jgi:glycosyltransferase involved in cell wall biosynthesis